MNASYLHITLRAARPWEPFTERAVCAEVWRAMGRHFPLALSAVIMPNHVHLSVPAEGRPLPERVGLLVRTLARIAGFPAERFVRPFGIDPIHDRMKLATVVRYHDLNPCRAGLAVHPLAWEWSGLREGLGLRHPAWIPFERGSAALGRYAPRTPQERLEWTAGDARVAMRLPVKLGEHAPVEAPLECVRAAVLGASGAAAVEGGSLRRLFIHVAAGAGWREVPPVLARALGVTPTRVRQALHEPLSPLEARQARAARAWMALERQLLVLRPGGLELR